MYRYARYFDGGPCFYAWPGEFTDRKATVEAFSSSDQQIQRFEADFRLVNGIDPKVSASRLSAAQCPAIAFLQKLDSDPEGAARLELRQTTVRAGQRLQGELAGTGDRTVALLAIGDTGRVRVLSNARHERGKTVIDQRLDDDDNSLPGSKLLIALAASRPFSSLASIPAGKAMAWDVLPALLEEAAARKNDPVATLAVPRLVRIEK
jgi:serine/threonine-protein kinase